MGHHQERDPRLALAGLRACGRCGQDRHLHAAPDLVGKPGHPGVARNEIGRDDQQLVLRCVAVFRGGFALEAAQAVEIAVDQAVGEDGPAVGLARGGGDGLPPARRFCAAARSRRR